MGGDKGVANALLHLKNAFAASHAVTRGRVFAQRPFDRTHHAISKPEMSPDTHKPLTPAEENFFNELKSKDDSCRRIKLSLRGFWRPDHDSKAPIA
jgi:hypothetical protein